MKEISVMPFIFTLPFFFIFLWGIILAVGLATTVFWLLMLIDLLKKDFKNKDDKIIWLIVLLLGQFIGAVIYFFMVKTKKN